MNSLITGITGFVGTHLAEHLLAAGNRVLGTCRRGAWPASIPAALASTVPLAAWDFDDQAIEAASAERAVAGFAPDVIYHLAALGAPGNCGESCPTPRASRINVEGLERVLKLAARLPRRPRIVFISSSHVYAPVSRERCRVREDSPVGPWRGYGMTKLAAEQAVHRAVAEEGANCVVVRAFQHLGPRQPGWSMLSEWARHFARPAPDPVRVFNRDTLVDATDVRDVVRAYRMLALHGRAGETYNVGSGVARLSGEILDVLRGMADPERAIVETAPGERTDPIADITRLVDRTGWRPEVPLEQSVADTLRWWRVSLATPEESAR